MKVQLRYWLTCIIMAKELLWIKNKAYELHELAKKINENKN